MGYADYLRELLRPLGIYRLEADSLSGAELEALGEGMDACGEALETVEREGILATAEGEGLSRRESLFDRRPVQVSVPLRRQAVAALSQVSGDSFTLADINRAIRGCGINAQAQETGAYGQIRIIFPDVAGIPEGIDQIRRVILDLIPCHLETEFYYRYLTWAECEARGLTWAMIHADAYTWHEFELAVGSAAT